MALETIAKPGLINKAAFYDKLPQTDAQWAKDKAVEFKQSANRSITEWELQGNLLIEVKQRLGHGSFTEWVETELTPNYKVGIDTAERLMNAAKVLKDRPKLGGYGYSLLAELSKTSTPPEIIEEAEARADTDNPMSVREVQKKVKEAKPKPLFQKGQFVEVDNFYGQIESIHPVKEQGSFEYKIKKLHGPSIKGKFPEQRLTLCPVQDRQNHYDDCTNKPQVGSQIIYCPITSWGQPRKGQIFTVLASLTDSVCIRGDDDQKVNVHWAELKPYEPVETELKAEEAIVDVQAVEVKQYINGLPLTPKSDIQGIVNELYARISELEDGHIQLLLDGLNAEISNRTQAKIA